MLTLQTLFGPEKQHTLSPFTTPQINRKPEHLKRKSRKLNRVIGEYKIEVEHQIGELKRYKVLSTLWRHSRPKLTDIVETCAALVNRHYHCLLKYQLQ